MYQRLPAIQFPDQPLKWRIACFDNFQKRRDGVGPISRKATNAGWLVSPPTHEDPLTRHLVVSLDRPVRSGAIASKPSRPRERRIGRRARCRAFSPCPQDGRWAKRRRAFSKLFLVQRHIKFLTVRDLITRWGEGITMMSQLTLYNAVLRVRRTVQVRRGEYWSRRDIVRMARRLNAGNAAPPYLSTEGTAELTRVTLSSQLLSEQAAKAAQLKCTTRLSYAPFAPGRARCRGGPTLCG